MYSCICIGLHTSRSIMVIEDIDCAKLEDREKEEKFDQLIQKKPKVNFLYSHKN